MKSNNKKLHLQTKVIHVGNEVSNSSSRDITQPIHLSTTFERNEDGTMGDYVYTRADNPNRKLVEQKIAAIENAAEAISFSSGMAAINALFENLLAPNSHIIIPNDCYHGTRALLHKFFTQKGVTFSEVEMTDLTLIENTVETNTKLIWIETPSNPQLKITDIEAVVNIAAAKKISVACDNTFATSIIQNPLAMGVDFVMHSSTKFFSGHSDILGGIVLAKTITEKSTQIREYQKIAGAVPAPFDCWLLNRSLATFAIRVPLQNANAMAIANYLHAHSKIDQVFYPGLISHKNHDIATKQMIGGFGSIFSVLIKGSEKDALQFASKLNLIKHATSLGGVESLVEHRRSVEGDNPISPVNLLRFSIGIEHVDDLINDIEQALV